MTTKTTKQTKKQDEPKVSEQAQEQGKSFVLVPEELFAAVAKYIIVRPYAEVHELIPALNNCQRVHKQTEE